MYYMVTLVIPYEGEYHESFDNLEEIKGWINKNKHRGYKSYDDLTILEVAREIDVYELMKEA